MIPNVELGKKIKIARTQKGWTQEELSEKLNVSKQAVSNWERGENRIDEGIRESLEEILGISLAPSFRRKGNGSMIAKPLEQIDNIDELLGYAEQIVEKTPVDNAFSSSVKKLLQLVLNIVLGYEVYALSFRRKADEKENKENPNMPFPNITTYDWNDVAEDIMDLLNDEEPYPISSKDKAILAESGNIFVKKIKFMLHSVGSELFEDFDDEGYRDGYIQQIGRIAESDAYDLLGFLNYHDNVILTSFRISLLQMAEIIGNLTQT